MPWVYLIRCRDSSFYVGSTFDLELRVWQHLMSPRDGAAYVRKRRPAELVWLQWYDSVAEAYGVERKLHGWRRAKKIALVEGRYDDLPGLSRKQEKVGPAAEPR